jgi:hypothetical protein
MHIKAAGIAIYVEFIKAMSTFQLNHPKESKGRNMIQKLTTQNTLRIFTMGDEMDC